MNLEKMRKQLAKDLDDDRLEHSLSVAYTATNLACIYGVDVEEALIAGYLHDCAKCFSDDKKLDLAKKYDIKVSKIEKDHPTLLHAKLGAELARDKYDVEDRGILDAIKFHTMGRADMSKLEQVIFVADYIEPNRNKAPDLLEIRKLAFTDLDLATFRVLEGTLAHLKEEDKEIEPSTIETFNYYKALIEKRDASE